MSMILHSEPILRQDEKGAIRIGDTRVTLDVILEDYYAGESPQAIAANYPSISLADVHEAIAYALRHPKAVEEYLRRRKEEAETLRRTIESGQTSNAELRDKLLARKAKKEEPNASPAP
jgi:uncharacterized protein (DUF433 family)